MHQLSAFRLLALNPIQRRFAPGYVAVLSHTHTYSGRSDHGGAEKPPGSYRALTQWARSVGVDALGMGSPYTPGTVKEHDCYDGENREAYYQPGFAHRRVRGDAEINAMLCQANEIGEGRPHYFLDNETPKGRYGHMWWVNYQLDYPAWHDYDQEFDRWMVEVSEAGDTEAEPMPYLRRPYREILAGQRAGGALGVWAHPTSWWTGERGQFITNIASEMPAHAWADGGLDGLVVMGYHARRPEYQQLWFALLDRGLRVPGVAEMDASLSDAPLWRRSRAYLTLVKAAVGRVEGPVVSSADGKGNISAPALAAQWGSGCLIASCAAWVEIEVDGVPMGQVARSGGEARHRISLRLGGECSHYDVELVGRGGQVVWSRDEVPAGDLELACHGCAGQSYVLARVRGCGSGETAETEVYAVSNPVYLQAEGHGFQAPLNASVAVALGESSSWRGAVARAQDAGGEVVEEFELTGGRSVCVQMPAGGRIVLEKEGRQSVCYLINHSPAIMELQRYLYRGRFWKDAPQLRPGEVPVEYWRLDEFRETLREIEWVL